MVSAPLGKVRITATRTPAQDQAYRIGRAARIRGLDLEADELMQPYRGQADDS